MQDKRERRYRYYSVSAEQIMMLLGNWHHRDFISLPRISGLPDGYRIDSIHHRWETDAFVIRVYHPSFDPVPIDGHIPLAPEVEVIQIDMAQVQPINQN